MVSKLALNVPRMNHRAHCTYHVRSHCFVLALSTILGGGKKKVIDFIIHEQINTQ